MARYKINSLAAANAALNAAPPRLQSSGATKRAYKLLKTAASDKSALGRQIAANLKTLDNMGDFDEKKSAYYQNAFHSLKDAYRQSAGEQMRHTAALAAENTGGFGNSYAATAASRGYADKMAEFSGKVPSLYNAAAEEFASRKSALQSLLALRQAQQQNKIERAQAMLAAHRSLDQQRYEAARFEDSVRRANAERFLRRYYGS